MDNILRLTKKWRSKEEIVELVKSKTTLSSETIGRYLRLLVTDGAYQVKPKTGKKWNIYRKL